MSRSFLVDSLIGNNSPPNYPLPYYAGNQLPNYMFNLFNLGLGYHPVRPVPRPPTLPVVPVPICNPQTIVGLPMTGQSPPSPINSSASRLSGNSQFSFHSILNPFFIIFFIYFTFEMLIKKSIVHNSTKCRKNPFNKLSIKLIIKKEVIKY